MKPGKISDELVYMLADILEIPLHRVGDGIKAATKVQQDVGPFVLDFEIMAKSDVLSLEESSMLVRIGKALWMYVIVDDKKNAKLYVFNGDVAGLTKSLMTTPCENGSVDATLKKITKAQGIPYAFNEGKGKWIQQAMSR